jgi:uncharacterized protein
VSRPILLAHGAGAGPDHPAMRGWAERLAAVGPVQVLTYPYMQAGRKLPDRLPRLVEAHREALRALHASTGRPVLLVGRSMGGRVGCHVAVAEPDRVAGVVCLAYPLRTPKGRVRDQVLRHLPVPALFVQGTRDRMAPLDLLGAVRREMSAPTRIHVVEDGDHGLQVAKRTLKATGTTQAAHDAAALAAIRDFAATLDGGAPRSQEGA